MLVQRDLVVYLGECYTGSPLNCKGMQVKVFGSDGQGTIAEPIIGALSW